MWDRLNDVAAYGEVKTAVGGSKLEHALVLEGEPRREPCVARARELQVVIDDVDSEHAGLREELGQPRCRLAGAAARVEYSRIGRERVATKQRHFLRPDRARLRGEIA